MREPVVPAQAGTQSHQHHLFYGTGIIPDDKLPTMMLAQFVTKVGVEVLFTPATYLIVARLKKAEQENCYDRDTNFTPFSLK